MRSVLEKIGKNKMKTYNAQSNTDMLETVLNRTKGRYLSEEEYNLVKTLMAYRENKESIMYPKGLTDKELIVFLMDEIDDALELLVDGQTHMATGVLGECHSKIRKHLSK